MEWKVEDETEDEEEKISQNHKQNQTDLWAMAYMAADTSPPLRGKEN